MSLPRLPHLSLWLSSLALLCSACTPAPPPSPGEDATPPLLYLLGSPGPDYTKAAATTPEGDVVMTLTFNQTLTLDGASETLTSLGGADVGVVVYEPECGKVRRKFRFGGQNVQVPHGVAVDASGHIVLIGYTRCPGAVNLDPTLSAQGERSCSGGEKPFVARYSSDGRLLWGHVLDHPSAASGYSRAWDVALDAAGDVYVGGSFSGSLDLDASAAEHVVSSVNGSADLFVARYAATTGALLWGFSVGGSGGDAGPEGTPVAPGGTGDMALAVREGYLYLQGEFRATADFRGASPSSAASTQVSAGGTDLFIARYATATGAFDKMIRMGNGSNESAAPGALRVDGAGNLYFSGRFSGTLALGGAAAPLTHTGPGSAPFLTSLDADLTPRWAVPLESDGGLDGVHRVLPDTAGNVYLAGWFNGGMDFDGLPSTAPQASRTSDLAGSDMFLASYSATQGAFRWVALQSALQPHGDNNIIAALAVDGQGAPWVGGQIFNATAFDDQKPATSTLAPVGQNDAFVARYDAASGRLHPACR